MAQWVNHLQNNIFINPLPLPLLCEISGAWQAGRQAGWHAHMHADKITKISGFTTDRHMRHFTLLSKCTASL